MLNFFRLFQAAVLVSTLFVSGCGGYDPPKNPGEGDDAPVMQDVPDAKP